MSRLIVKNLPKIITEEKLKNLFEKYGEITDFQLKYKDGTFRQFAFVGYKDECQAKKAIESLNETFISTSKISVQPCALLGDLRKPKSWSKYAPDSNTFKSKNKNTEKQKEGTETKKETVKENDSLELIEKYKSDPLFEDFLQVHKKEAQSVEKLLSAKVKSDSELNQRPDIINKDEEDVGKGEEKGDGEGEASNKLANTTISDLDYMKLLKKKSEKPQTKKVKEKVDFFTIKLKGLPHNCKKKDIKAFLKPLTAQSIRVPPKIHGIAFVGFKDEKKFKKALMKNKSFLSGRQVIITKYDVDKKHDKEKSVEDLKKSRWISQEESISKEEEKIAESGRIFVRNLAYITTEDDLRTLFEKYGPITELNIPIDSNTRASKGFGTITFLLPEHAVKAYSELDGTIFQGRMLHLLPAKSKDTTEDFEGETTNYKQKKAAQQKAKAGQSYNWNALFLGHDAVAEVISESFGGKKEDIVGPEGKGSAAVRLALGETKIVAETKKYLEAAGVLLDAFTTPNCKRSNKVILVKNLPFHTTSQEIRELFEKHGVISRIILPPSAITAIVEFDQAAEARKAFKRLAYSKFKNMPLYLEWAPDESLKENNMEIPKNVQHIQEPNGENDLEQNEASDNDEEEPEPDTTLFVKNLNFKTTDEDLKKAFESCGKIHYATVAKKKDAKNPGSTLSMGYGFVRFKTKAGIDKALKTMQQFVLDGKSLELKRSERVLPTDVQAQRKASKKTKQNGTKLLVRNVPFQANEKEIQELFTVFGEIKALRLPRKLSGESHRGFAFVDYVSNSDAKKAFEALSQSTHLYGRRLVLEWAEIEGEEKSGKRSAEHFQMDSNDKCKKTKSVFNIE